MSIIKTPIPAKKTLFLHGLFLHDKTDVTQSEPQSTSNLVLFTATVLTVQAPSNDVINPFIGTDFAVKPL